MSKVQPYLIFNGNCEEAMNFYCQVLGGIVQFLTRFKEGPMEVPEHWKEKIMHGNFLIGQDQLMCCDSFPASEVQSGGQVNLSVNFEQNEKIDEIFHQLSQGGKVTMDLQNTFWKARFGQLVDQFGVSWMLNQHLEEN